MYTKLLFIDIQNKDSNLENNCDMEKIEFDEDINTKLSSTPGNT
jgi:hypothetical protein